EQAMPILYVFDNAGMNGEVADGANYTADGVTHGVAPGTSDSVNASGKTFHGTITVDSWHFGTLTAGAITAQTAADNMTISGGSLNAAQADHIIALGTGIVSLTTYTGGAILADDTGHFTADNVIDGATTPTSSVSF